MKIDDTEFGSITIAGKTYEHDVVIRLSDNVVKRKKKLSKRLYGTRTPSRRTKPGSCSRKAARS
jgi:hypothetical protein